MRATKLARIVAQVRDRRDATRIAVNTWDGYIREGRRSRELLRTVASQVDFFILNEAEAKALTRTTSLATALPLLTAQRCIVTLGTIGALVGGDALDVQLVPALHMPVGRVVDTTGAGDVWCGAFLAAYLRTGQLAQSMSIAAILSSVKCTGWGFDRLLPLRFRRPEDVIQHVIGLREGGVQTRLSDFAAETG
jgi:ribokinase